MDFDLYMLEFVLNFVKLYLFIIDEICVEFLIQVFYDEINNDLFNEFILYFINFIIELKFSVNMQKFKFIQIIDNELRVQLNLFN